MNSARRLATMKEQISLLDGQMIVHKEALKRALRNLKSKYMIDSTKAARDRFKQIEAENEQLQAKIDEWEAKAEELMNEFD